MTAARVLVVGGGIAGLAGALALERRGHGVVLLEQSGVFSEAGAGIQLAPNATRRLQALGLLERLRPAAIEPEMLVLHSADVGEAELARWPLQQGMARYGAPYLCVHRADLHAALLDAVRSTGGVALETGARIEHVAIEEGAGAADAQPAPVAVATSLDGRRWTADGLIGADGLWSVARARVTDDDGPPVVTGHTAFRALIEQSALPASLRSRRIDVWLGPRLHALAYPVRGGEALNVVVLAETAPAGDARDWDQAASRAGLDLAVGRVGRGLRALLDAMPQWRAWTLCDRAPMTGAAQLARGPLALVGDAAHPMLPYLAQGAAMAIEDAVALADMADGCDAPTWSLALQRYADARWQRNARVQAKARSNGRIFHATGPTRLARDAALRLAGRRLMDTPWLYGG